MTDERAARRVRLRRRRRALTGSAALASVAGAVTAVGWAWGVDPTAATVARPSTAAPGVIRADDVRRAVLVKRVADQEKRLSRLRVQVAHAKAVRLAAGGQDDHPSATGAGGGTGTAGSTGKVPGSASGYEAAPTASTASAGSSWTGSGPAAAGSPGGGGSYSTGSSGGYSAGSSGTQAAAAPAAPPPVAVAPAPAPATHTTTGASGAK